MAATPSILVKYTVNGFEGGSKVVTNRYHFSGGVPADSAHWETFTDLVVTNFKATLGSSSTITEVNGYDASTDVAVFTKTYTTAGTISESGKTRTPAFCCALLRWATTARTTKNHPVYLFSYIHGIFQNSQLAPGCDEVESSQYTALGVYSDYWCLTGFSDGTNTYFRAGPNGATGVSSTVNLYIGVHDLSPR